MSKEKTKPRRRSIIELSHKDARNFFLKHESYSPFELPPYFKFESLIQKVSQDLEGADLYSKTCKKPYELEQVNHKILNNKDGRYAWRPYELIHPALYVSIVNEMTKKDSWKLICDCFRNFSRDKRIKCTSIPVKSLTDESDRAEQIRQWLEGVEQRSIELSLDYDFVVNTDIVNCYAAIYTHSIAWALHGKECAKAHRENRSLVGNKIDAYIRDMRYGQTNGIPQGSILMDFISEMVLGYADSLLTDKIKCDSASIKDFQILRYKDDYRIFVKNAHDGSVILRCLTEVMIELGIQLKPEKTRASSEVIRSSIKEDKLDWLFRRNRYRNFQKQLLVIHDHSTKHMNSGSVHNALTDFYKRLEKSEKRDNPLPLISIVVDIARRDPRTYPISTAIISKLVSYLNSDSDKKKVIGKIKGKFANFPNTGHIEIWLQRISLQFDREICYEEPLCRIVNREEVTIWNNDWISSKNLRKIIDPEEMIDREAQELSKEEPVIPLEEVQMFKPFYHG